ncbi:hypothetical protein HPB49_009244 [Dermacentor silvarum]|uniref:Uncharacterized protein n=1 Tax=Dermacentor silvarum TaxID=543639 RepID=A0ACB8DY53_DERSI|nr:hypothetical protein HPB49_009244 [Dermacentor silvarum]
MHESTVVPTDFTSRSNKTVHSSAPKRRRSSKDPLSPGVRLTMGVRMRLLSDLDSETTSIVLVVITPAPEVIPTPATSRHPTTEEYTMVSPNSKRRSNEATQSSATKRRQSRKDPPSPGVRGAIALNWLGISTGTGKAFALLGSEECPGVVSLMASELYQRAPKLQSEGQTCDVAVAYLEVYNKVVRILLCLDPAINIALLYLTIHKVKEAGTLLEPIMKGKNRTQHATDADAESSWSHAIFQSYVTVTENVTSTSKETRVSMCSVDLAGSECAAAASRDSEDQMREGTKLNLSLLALGNCIDARSKNGTQHVSYQDSKLTHILKDSLGGSGNALVIGTATALKLRCTRTYNYTSIR